MEKTEIELRILEMAMKHCTGQKDLYHLYANARGYMEEIGLVKPFSDC